MHRRMMFHVALKIFLVTTIILVCYIDASNLPPRPSGPVADYAGVLDNTTKLRINALARSLWVENKFGLIVTTVKETGAVSAERYAADLYRSWGAGVKASPEDAIILLSINPPGAHVHVGAGARRYLSGASMNRLLAHNGTPHFIAGDYNRGLLELSQKLALSVQNRRDRRGTIAQPFLADAYATGLQQLRNHPWYMAITIAGLTTLLVLIRSGAIFRNVRHFDYCSSAFGGGVDGGVFGGSIR